MGGAGGSAARAAWPRILSGLFREAGIEPALRPLRYRAAMRSGIARAPAHREKLMMMLKTIAAALLALCAVGRRGGRAIRDGSQGSDRWHLEFHGRRGHGA